MDSNIQFWIQTILTVFAIVVYVSLFIYQRHLIKASREHLVDLQNMVKIYKDLVNINDIKAHTEIKIENARNEEKKKYQDIVTLAIEKVVEAVKDDRENTKNVIENGIQDVAGGVAELIHALSIYIAFVHNTKEDALTTVDKFLVHSPDYVRNSLRERLLIAYTEKDQLTDKNP